MTDSNVTTYNPCKSICGQVWTRSDCYQSKQNND